jgi:uncharacterized membrane protein YhaH (DUF805 family)
VSAATAEKSWERYAWILVVVNGVIWLLFALSDVLFGGNLFQSHAGYPAAAVSDLDMAQRVLGAFGIPAAVFQIAVGLRPFKSREKWAWFALLSVPIATAVNSYLDVKAGVFIGLAVSLFLLYSGLLVLGLLLSIRKFFPAK